MQNHRLFYPGVQSISWKQHPLPSDGDPEHRHGTCQLTHHSDDIFFPPGLHLDYASSSLLLSQAFFDQCRSSAGRVSRLKSAATLVLPMLCEHTRSRDAA